MPHPPPHPPPKKKKQKKQKESPQRPNITVLAILERQKYSLSIDHDGRQYFSVFHGPSTLKSISPLM